MPCRCDDYETNSSEDKIKDLETRLCRAQSVIKDIWANMAPSVSARQADPCLVSRISREIAELEKHKAVEAANEKAEREYYERKVQAAHAALDHWQAELAKKRQP